MNSFWRKQGIIEAPVISQGCKGVFRDAWRDLNYQCDAWLGPNELHEGWLGIAVWCVIYFFHNSWRVSFLWNFHDGYNIYHLKLEAGTLKIDGYYFLLGHIRYWPNLFIQDGLIITGLTLRARGWGFLPATMRVALGYLYNGKWKKSITKRNHLLLS